MKRPVPDLPADARQCLLAGSRQETVAKMRLSGLTHIRLSGSELVAQKIEVDVRVVAAPVHVLAVDDPRLNRMGEPACSFSKARPLGVRFPGQEHQM